jgi:hypothetical protein
MSPNREPFSIRTESSLELSAGRMFYRFEHLCSQKLKTLPKCKQGEPFQSFVKEFVVGIHDISKEDVGRFAA